MRINSAFADVNSGSAAKRRDRLRSGLAAKIAGADLGLRRRVDQAVFELRRELAQAAIKLADERGEPPLSEQGSETRPSLKSAAGR